MELEKNWPAYNVERRKVATLSPYVRNARTHSDDQVDQIAKSMDEFGWTMPVLVDEKDNIIAGHGRILAARKRGIEEFRSSWPAAAARSSGAPTCSPTTSSLRTPAEMTNC